MQGVSLHGNEWHSFSKIPWDSSERQHFPFLGKNGSASALPYPPCAEATERSIQLGCHVFQRRGSGNLRSAFDPRVFKRSVLRIRAVVTIAPSRSPHGAYTGLRGVQRRTISRGHCPVRPNTGHSRSAGSLHGLVVSRDYSQTPRCAFTRRQPALVTDRWKFPT